MMRVIADEKRRYGQMIPNHWYGYELCAQWWEWHAEEAANASEVLSYAAHMKKLSQNAEPTHPADNA